MKWVVGLVIEKLIRALIKFLEKLFRDVVEKEQKKADRDKENEKQLKKVKDAQTKQERIAAARDLLNG